MTAIVMPVTRPATAANMPTLASARNCWRRRSRLSGTMPAAVSVIRRQAAAMTGKALAASSEDRMRAAAGMVIAVQIRARPKFAQKAELRSERETSAFCSIGLDRMPPVRISATATDMIAMPKRP